jgi:hypothetical protein
MYWAGTADIQILFIGQCHGATWTTAVEGGGAVNCPIGGIYWPGPTWSPHPKPYALYWEAGGSLKLALRLMDGSEAFLTIAANVSTAVLNLDIRVNVAAGTAVATVNGSSATVTGTVPSGKTLDTNTEWPWVMGRSVTAANGGHGWDADNNPGRVDFTCTKWEFHNHTRGIWCALTFGRPATYSGGPSLPLLGAASSWGTRHVYVVHSTQGIPDLVGGVTLDNVKVQMSGPPHAAVTMGSIQGGLTVNNCQFYNGTRGVQSSELAVTYPVRILGSTLFADQQETALKLWQCGAGFSVEHCTFARHNHRAAYLKHCHGTFDRCMIAPPSQSVTPVSVIDQYGGDLRYLGCNANYEWANTTPFVRLTPAGHDSADQPTKAIIERLVKVGTVYEELAAEANYTGTVTVTNDGAELNIGT